MYCKHLGVKAGTGAEPGCPKAASQGYLALACGRHEWVPWNNLEQPRDVLYSVQSEVPKFCCSVGNIKHCSSFWTFSNFFCFLSYI